MLLALALMRAAALTVAAQGSRDSAGIRIIENQRPAWTAQTRQRLSERPVLTIGDRAGDAYLFSRIAGALRLTGGTIVVADGGSKELRYFDSTGSFVRKVGGPGNGPGEFPDLGILYRTTGDTLAAGAMMGQHSYFASTGAFVRHAAPVIGSGLPPGPKIVMGVFGDQGTVVVVPNMRPPPNPPERWADSVPIFLVDRTATRLRTTGPLPMMTMGRSTGGEVSPVWFGATAAFAAAGASLYFGFGAEYSIREYSADGTLRRIIRRQWAPRRVTREDIDAYVLEWSRRWIKPNDPDRARRIASLRADAYAEHVPAFSQFLVDRTGRLWVREANILDAPGCGCLNETPLVASSWNVFDASGRWLGDVAMPARFAPKDIGADYVLGVARDSDGVESVVLYGLR